MTDSYPMRGNMFVHPSELDLPDSHLNTRNPYNSNNHHLAYEARTMARSVILQTVRDLDMNQQVLPKDVHEALHTIYRPPAVPSPVKMMAVVDDAYQDGRLLRYGSARHPDFTIISDELLKECTAEYERIKPYE